MASQDFNYLYAVWYTVGMSRLMTPEHRAKISEALRGKPKSAEHRAKLSEARKAMPINPAFVDAGKTAAVGRKWSETSRRKISAAKTVAPLASRFWAKVKIGAPDECWEWQGCRQAKTGYGSVGIGSRIDGTKGTMLAHRLAWELTHGPIPKGIKVRHLVCDNPPCCNPAHLALGTQAQNVSDMIGKGRKRVVRGSAHPSSKLTDEAKQTIRELYAAGGVSQVQLAQQFHVNQPTISRVIRNKPR